MDLSHCHALITGASRGLGAALASRLQAEGAAVVGAARSFQGRLRAAPAPNSLQTIHLDVSDPESVESVFQDLSRHGWQISVLVNNAGWAAFKPLEQLSEQDWTKTIDTNLNGAFRCTRLALPGMKRRGEGKIVNMGSIADHVVLPENAAYACAKFGLRALTEATNVEAAAFGVRATLLSLGATDTPIWDARPDFSRTDMLSVDEVVETLMHVLTRPSSVRMDELKLFPPKRIL